MEFICLTYGIPSLFLSLFFLKLLTRNEFKYSFYRILQCDMILNILCYLNGWFGRFCNWSVTVPMMLAIYENYYVIFHFTTFCVNFYFNAQAMSVIFMSVHRLTSSRYVSMNTFWNKYYFPLYIAILLLSMGLALYIYIAKMILPNTYNYSSQVFVSTAAEPTKRATLLKIFFCESLIYFTTILVINILTILLIRKRFVSSTSPKTQTLMRNLTLIAIINSSLFFFVFLWQWFGQDALGLKVYVSSMYILSDAISLSLPYILLALDRNVRSVLACLVGKKAVLVAKAMGYNNYNPAQRTTSVVSVY